jgi:uncharacterized protein
VSRPLAVRAFQGLVTAYQVGLSPFLGRHCRFVPSCSRYAHDAVGSYGLWRGSRLAVQRLVRCHPFHAGGYDPVPPVDRAEAS